MHQVLNRVYRNRKILIGNLLLLFVLLSCKKDDFYDYSIEDDTIGDPIGLFDYANIQDHPRLLLTNERQSQINELINNNEDFRTVHEYVLNRANQMLLAPPLTYALEGKRLQVSRQAMARIVYLAYAFRMTEDTKFLNRAEKEINAVCNFPNWNPSHFLDVSEMAVGVAIGYDWLFNDLSADTKTNIRRALYEFAILPSKTNIYAPILKTYTNWNQVCNTGMLFAAVSTYESNKVLAKEIIERSYHSIQLPLSKYYPNGNYTEGYNYWRYGTTYQVLFIALLESAFKNDNGLSLQQGFLETAKYMLFMVGPTGKPFNYGDNATNQNYNPALFWFAKRLNDPSILFHEKDLINGGGIYTNNSNTDRFLPFALLFGENKFDLSTIPNPKDTYFIGYGDVPVSMTRSDWTKNAAYLAIKGGAAQSGHGHMDAGSFVFEKDEVRWAIDLGLQNYLELEKSGIDLWNYSQASSRWSVLRYNNNYHNTLTVNGQNHNVAGKASITNRFNTPVEKGIELDLTPVLYPELTNSKRKLVLINGNYAQIEDNVITGNKPTIIKWSMVTNASPIFVDKNTIELNQNGKSLMLRISTTETITLQSWSTSPQSPSDADNFGSVIIGFESVLPPNHTANYKVTLGK